MTAAGCVLVWEFAVAPERRDDFERRYGTDGDWARLFARADGFLGTRLLRDAGTPGRYLTLDHWRSDADWQAFRVRYAEQYAALDRDCEALTLSEARIGAFAEVGAWAPLQR
jgi:heme-degrading monooxygenase HmoA